MTKDDELSSSSYADRAMASILGSAGTARLAPPDDGQEKKFILLNPTQETEDQVDLIAMRRAVLPRPTGNLATTLHLVKAALGSGILSGHVAYKNAGYLVALITNVCIGVFMLVSLRGMIDQSHTLCKRTGRPYLTYADTAECALALSKIEKLHKYAKVLRYCVDAAIAIELFGSCCTYQLVIAKTVKQLVEDQQRQFIAAGKPGYPDLRIYVLIIMIPCMLISLLRYLKLLAPFSFLANIVIGLCIVMTIYYATQENPGFKNMIPAKGFEGFLTFSGMIIFGMSCSSQMLTIENNMSNPYNFKLSLSIAMVFIMGSVMSTAFFGYVAYREDSEAPVTVNFPMDLYPKILKGCVAIMVWITHALNFFVPFSCMWVYIRRRLKPSNHVKWEYFFRALFVIIIGCIGAAFPSINLLMGFLGCFCLSNVAIIWPQFIEIANRWGMQGFGPFKWRLWKCIIFCIFGLFFLIAGTIVHAADLPEVFR